VTLDDLVALVDNRQCSPQCLFGQGPGPCCCVCGGRYHGTARTGDVETLTTSPSQPDWGALWPWVNQAFTRRVLGFDLEPHYPVLNSIPEQNRHWEKSERSGLPDVCITKYRRRWTVRVDFATTPYDEWQEWRYTPEAKVCALAWHCVGLYTLVAKWTEWLIGPGETDDGAVTDYWHVSSIRDERIPRLLAVAVDECWMGNEGTALNVACEVARFLPEELQRNYGLERHAAADWRSGIRLARPRGAHD
jgi:hypothetical protein